MRNLEVKSLRAAMRSREGELRAIPMERIRHEMRRAAASAERARVATLRSLWADYGHDGERLA